MDNEKRTDTGPRVFIPNLGAGHDYSDAERFGKLVFVTEGTINPFDTGVMKRAWHAALRGSKPEDFIVVTSLNTLCMIGAGEFVSKHGRLNLLIFSNAGKYRRREIIFKKEKRKCLRKKNGG